MATAIRVFMDIQAGTHELGRVTFELYPGIAPQTVENFRCLCVGDRKSVVAYQIRTAPSPSPSSLPPPCLHHFLETNRTNH
eukprot:m.194186 g.194186  ORF g.194186 m.194186 type:complete len:81 (-) comp24996_c0_seq6:105-347(-)